MKKVNFYSHNFFKFSVGILFVFLSLFYTLENIENNHDLKKTNNSLSQLHSKSKPQLSLNNITENKLSASEYEELNEDDDDESFNKHLKGKRDQLSILKDLSSNFSKRINRESLKSNRLYILFHQLKSHLFNID